MKNYIAGYALLSLLLIGCGTDLKLNSEATPNSSPTPSNESDPSTNPSPTPTPTSHAPMINATSFDSSGNFYFVDTASYKIRKVAAGTGLITTVIGDGTVASSSVADGTDGLSSVIPSYVSSLVVNNNGDIYYSSAGVHVVYKWKASDGKVYKVAGTWGSHGLSGDDDNATSAQLFVPARICIDTERQFLYIADYDNQRLRKVDLNTGVISTVNGSDGDQGVYSCAIDPDGYVYWGDAAHLVRKTDPAGSGTVSVVAGIADEYSAPWGDNGPATSAHIGAPYGLTFDSLGNLYIASSGEDYTVRKVDTEGTITTVAGTNGDYTACGGNGGLATSATFNNIEFITADLDDNLYVASYYDEHSIRKISKEDGLVNDFAGKCDEDGDSGDSGPATSARITFPNSFVNWLD